MPNVVDEVAAAATDLAAAKEAKLRQLRLAKQKKREADSRVAGKSSAASRALNFGKAGPPPTAPKPFYKKFTIYVQTTNGTLARYIGASAETTVGELKRWAFYNAFPDECKSIYKLGFAFDGVELAETMTLEQLGFTRGPEIRKRPIIMNPSRYPILQRDADEGLQVESDEEGDDDKLKLGKKKKPAEEMTDPERRAAALAYFNEKCKRSFPDTVEISSEDLLEMLKDRSPKLMLVDCRSAPECTVSMLPGAIHQKEFQGVVVPVLRGNKKRPKDAPWKTPTQIVAYCGNSVRSGKLLQKCQKELLKKVKDLQVFNHLGSISDWCHVGGALAQGQKQGKGGKVLRGSGPPTNKVHGCTRRFLVNFPTEKDYDVVL